MTYLYRLYDVHEQLLYVGITVDLPKRLEKHKRDKSWFEDVAELRTESFESREKAAAAELVAIRTEGPRYNVACPVGRVPRSRNLRKWQFAMPTGVGDEYVRVWIEARTEEHAKRLLTQALAHAARQQMTAIRLTA